MRASEPCLVVHACAVGRMLWTAEARQELLSRVCIHMNTRCERRGHEYGGSEVPGTMKWWCDLAWLARNDMEGSERRRLIQHLTPLRAQTLALSLHQPPSSAAAAASQGSVGKLDAEDAEDAEDRGDRGARLPLHWSVREADELTRSAVSPPSSSLLLHVHSSMCRAPLCCRGKGAHVSRGWGRVSGVGCRVSAAIALSCA